MRGNSPVVGYEIEATRITVWFKDGKPYSYSYKKAGRENVEVYNRTKEYHLWFGSFPNPAFLRFSSLDMN